MIKYKKFKKLQENLYYHYGPDTTNTFYPNYVAYRQMQDNELKLNLDTPNKAKYNEITSATILNKHLLNTFYNNYSNYEDFNIDIENITLQDIVINSDNYIDVYIKIKIGDYEDEFFGVFKNFNAYNRDKFKSEIFNIIKNDKYKLILDNYLYNTLNKWFTPKTGEYKYIDEEELECKSIKNNNIKLKKNSIIKVKYIEKNNENNKIHIIYKNENYFIDGNEYYLFKLKFIKNE